MLELGDERCDMGVWRCCSQERRQVVLVLGGAALGHWVV